jgi:hypothetical protein
MKKRNAIGNILRTWQTSWKFIGNIVGTHFEQQKPKKSKACHLPKKKDVRWKSCAIANLGNILEIHWEHTVNNKNPKDPRTPSLPSAPKEIPRPFRCMLDNLIHNIHNFFS